MSAVDPRLNTSLPSLELDRQGPAFALEDPALAGLVVGDPLRTPAIDDGEVVLSAPAFAEGDDERQLDAGGTGYTLASMDLGAAVDAGVDGIVEGL